MPYPSLDDDGQSVTLDLHGATVQEAEDLAPKVVAEAARRGRDRVRIIHGSSTSSTRYRNRTIKHALYDLLEAGVLGPGIQSDLRSDDQLLLALDVSIQSDPSPIRLREIMR